MNAEAPQALHEADTKPWYRQAWPWFLIALPASAVIGSLVTAFLAMNAADGPVEADYYRQGLAINQQVKRVQTARELGLVATLDLAGFGQGDPVRVELEAIDAMPPAEELRLRLIHPGRPAADRTALLKRSGISADEHRAVYQGTLVASTPVQASRVSWQVALESRDWRIDDGLTAAGPGRFRLQAK